MWKIPVYGEDLKCEKEFYVRINYYVDVKNSKEVKAMLIAGQLEASCVCTTNVLSHEQILVAVNKALHSDNSGTMATRSVYSEVLYNLSPSLKITDSLRKFGIQDGSKEIISIQLSRSPSFYDLSQVIKGEEKPLDTLVSDEGHIAKVYDVTSEELQVGSLLEAVILRIATKEIN